MEQATDIAVPGMDRIKALYWARNDAEKQMLDLLYDLYPSRSQVRISSGVFAKSVGVVSGVELDHKREPIVTVQHESRRGTYSSRYNPLIVPLEPVLTKENAA